VVHKNLVYRKSAKGAEAIATRQHGLAPKSRSVLILVDGKRSWDQLASLAQGLGSTEDLLVALVSDGFIEPVAVAPVAAAATSSRPTAAAAGAERGPSLTDAGRFAVRRLTDLVGPNADDCCLRIEAAKNVREFGVAIKAAQEMLRQLRGTQAAEQFAAELQARMPVV
jgi:hypothetical protein